MSLVQRLARAILPPLVAAALMVGAFAGAARYSRSPVFAYDTWIKWDSGHYLTIANQGYELLNCPESSGYGPTQWCGNTGWFPGYPFLLRALHGLTGQPTIWLAIVVSQVFTLIDLWLVWNLFLGRQNLTVLALCAFAPGTYYFLVGFPISMVVCFILIALWAEREGHYDVAFISGALAGLTYPSGVWLAGTTVAQLLIRRWRGERWTKWAWLAAAGPAIGFGCVLLTHHASVGRWNAFFLSQDKYEHAIHNPLAVLWHRSLYIWAWLSGWQTGLQSLLASALVLGGAIGLAAAARRHAGDRGDLALSAFSLTYWLTPLAIGAHLSSYRAEALLMPAAVGVRRLSTTIQFALLGAAVAIWMAMVIQFIEGSLV